MEKRLYVWGSGGTGQLGLGTEVDYDLPQRWDNAQQLELESVVSGGCHSAGIRGDGRLFLWGLDDRGQLRRSKPARTQSVVTAPIQPVAFEHKTKLVACGWWHTLVVVSNDSTGDQAFSWGSNDNLQLGRDKSSAGCFRGEADGTANSDWGVQS
ncbi:RCC1 domain protein [Phytophthora cinnamomi]|uniref:RCC1 domain protein n=1 Tax=Phytophthora cinnamomi TaxID=4785 RepID=UPI00355AA2B0|nr:RCC1 domain protein [Phytophthora cinnamomi]